jgi:two-component system, NtrC family, response regulator AtoC
MTLPRLCVVEDDEIMGESLCDRFRLEGFEVDWHNAAAGAIRAIGTRRYAAVVSDVRLPDLDGEQMFLRLKQEHASLPPFLFITAFGSIDRAVQLLKNGASDYITKPFDLDRLVEKVRGLTAVRSQALGESAAQDVLGASVAMRRIHDSLPRLAKHSGTLVVTGESGVGKEHVAQLYHRHARDRDDCPFVAVNCAALPESLMEAELFGYEKGAFTGALRSKKGLFEQAHCGTLFLDEIGDMPLAMQAKLLRAVQERRITRVGGETAIAVDLRLVCATNRDLRKLVEEGGFREDLYYRINVIQIRIPPLRERREDVLWFLGRFLEDFRREHGGGPRIVDPAAEQALLDYPWPGNIRELKHAVERACILTPGPVLGLGAFFEGELPPREEPDESARSLNDHLARCERLYVGQVLERNRWQIAVTAAELGISRKNLWEKMRKLGIEPDAA